MSATEIKQVKRPREEEEDVEDVKSKRVRETVVSESRPSFGTRPSCEVAQEAQGSNLPQMYQTLKSLAVAFGQQVKIGWQEDVLDRFDIAGEDPYLLEWASYGMWNQRGDDQIVPVRTHVSWITDEVTGKMTMVLKFGDPEDYDDDWEEHERDVKFGL